MKRDEVHKYPVRVKKGVRQGCVLSPLLFNTYADEMMKRTTLEQGIFAYGNRRINTVIIAETEEDLNKLVNKIAVEVKKWSIEINLEKEKSMVVTGKGHKEVKIQIGSSRMEQVRKFQYLGVCIKENMSNDVGIKYNIARAKQSFWRNKELFHLEWSLNYWTA